MTTPLDAVLASVELRGQQYIRQPLDGQPLNEYAMQCMKVGAMLAVEPLAAVQLAVLGRASRLAEEALTQDR